MLRDRGYFVLAEIQRIIAASAYFIYRYKHGINYCDAQSGQPIDLLNILQQASQTDMPVRIAGANGQIVRLIALPVPLQIANQRRAQLKKDYRNNPSKEHLALLSWSIFITNIEPQHADIKQIFTLYRLRWRIEIVFKALKSYLNMDSIHTVSENQLKFIILGKMMMLIFITNCIYTTLSNSLQKFYNKELSILKLTQYLTQNLEILTETISTLNVIIHNKNHLLKIISTYCCYEKRKKRNNQIQILYECLS